ncbi:MAG: phosphoglycolate phosphatase [Proteobacteria bacterium ST_bin11]|jgi:phosphoglycolate phosphatase|nr:MAG: phosphoglycolate phosphatase [Proteobacteria bacterium ST_bin11]
MTGFKLDCVLFDLDGTLVDTAPDLIACLNKTLLAHGFAEASADTVRPFISHGAMPMIRHSASVDDSLAQQMLAFMLDTYERNIAEHSRFFQGMADNLAAIEQLGLKWGVVTNKKSRFTVPLMEAMQLSERAACVVSGDTTPNSKPHPEPMLAACLQAGVSPQNCVYIGDAVHDITAGKRANMKTLAALYGYLKTDDQPDTWGADALIEQPPQLMEWIHAHLCH